MATLPLACKRRKMPPGAERVPDELLVVMLSYLTGLELWHGALPTCRRWHRMVKANPLVWRHARVEVYSQQGLIDLVQAALPVQVLYIPHVFDAPALAYLAAGLPRLRTLMAPRCKASEALVYLATLPLESLSLHGDSDVTDRTFKTLSKLQELQELDVFGEGITDASLEHLTTWDRLHTLSIGRSITDSGLKHLSALSLTSLHLYGPISDAGLVHLSSLRLRSLNVSFCTGITDLGLVHLSHMPLEELNLTYCKRVTGSGLVHCSKLPLRKLELSGTGLNDAGLEHLVAMPLRVLCAMHTPVTDSGLARLKGLPLECLDLQYCEFITDAGLVPLEALAPTLREINLYRCSGLTPKGVQRLVASLSVHVRVSTNLKPTQP